MDSTTLKTIRNLKLRKSFTLTKENGHGQSPAPGTTSTLSNNNLNNNAANNLDTSLNRSGDSDIRNNYNKDDYPHSQQIIPRMTPPVLNSDRH